MEADHGTARLVLYRTPGHGQPESLDRLVCGSHFIQTKHKEMVMNEMQIVNKGLIDNPPEPTDRRQAVLNEISMRMPAGKTKLEARKHEAIYPGFAAVMPISGRFLFCQLGYGTAQSHDVVALEIYGPYEVLLLSPEDRAAHRYIYPLENQQLLCWDVEEVLKACSARPGLSGWLTEWRAINEDALRRRVVEFCTLSIKARVAAFIRMMCERYPEDGSNHKETVLRHMTHEEVSWYVGTSREVISLHINDLARQRAVTWKRRFGELRVNLERLNECQK